MIRRGLSLIFASITIFLRPIFAVVVLDFLRRILWLFGHVGILSS